MNYLLNSQKYLCFASDFVVLSLKVELRSIVQNPIYFIFLNSMEFIKEAYGDSVMHKQCYLIKLKVLHI